MIRFILALALVFASTFASATDRHVCNCGTGSLPTVCVNGATGNPGTSGSPKQTVADYTAYFNTTSAAGDRVLLCRGGAWTSAQAALRNTAATAANPITFGAYTPSWANSTDSGNSTSTGTNTLTDSTKSWTTNQWAGYAVEAKGMTAGDTASVAAKGGAEYLIVSSNTATTLTFATNWLSKPLAITAYTLQAPRPILTDTTASPALLDLTVSGDDGNYVFQDLDVRGGGTGSNGIFTSGFIHDVKVQRVRLSGFTTAGYYCGISNPRFQLLNSVIQDNPGNGLLWACFYSLIEGNTFDTNGDSVGEHHIYLSLDFDVNNQIGKDIVIRGNSGFNNSPSGGSCTATAFVVHGQAEGLAIENNYLYETASHTNSGCFGISVNSGQYPSSVEFFKNVAIRGNTVVNMGNAPIGVGSTTKAIIENNVVLLTALPSSNPSSFAWYGFNVPNQIFTSGDDATTGTIFRNNTCIALVGNADDTFCIDLGEYAQNAGTGMVVANNLMYFGSSVNAAHGCFNLGDRTTSNFTAFVNNLCFNAGSGNWSSKGTGNNYSTGALAEAAGWGTGGVFTDPLLVNTPSISNAWDVRLQSGSPARGAGSNTYKAPQAHKGYPARPNPPDIGALQYGF